MRRLIYTLSAAVYVALTVFVAWSVLDPRSNQLACLLVFGGLCAFPAFVWGECQAGERHVSADAR